jgi:chromosome segregation ATPase
MTRHMVVVALLTLVVAGAVSGQVQRSPATLDDLLTEVRGLRADLNQSSSSSLRTQLLIGRVTLQEQRINALAGQLNDTRRALSSKQGDPESAVVRLKRFEDAVQIRTAPPEALVEMEKMLPRLQADAAIWQREEQALRSQENELSVLLATEQNRWLEVNSRLDDLERTLSR